MTEGARRSLNMRGMNLLRSEPLRLGLLVLRLEPLELRSLSSECLERSDVLRAEPDLDEPARSTPSDDSSCERCW